MFVCPECGASAEGAGPCERDGTARADPGTDGVLGTSLGSFRAARRLGRGGMGTVYLGVHPRIGSRVAVKVLHAEVAGVPDAVARFHAEARALAAIRHDGIVNAFDVGESADGRPFIVMELLAGDTLGELALQRGPLPLELAVRTLADVCDALEAAHARGIWHRDVKPHNVFVTTSGRTKLLDFGIAKLRRETAAGRGSPDDLVPITTVTGLLVGTPGYVAPEQVAGETADHRADLYALGVVAFEVLAGRRPFEAVGLFELLQQHVHAAPPPLRSLRPDAPAALEALVARALAKRPADRPPSAAAFGAALRAIQAELGAPRPAPEDAGPVIVVRAPARATVRAARRRWRVVAVLLTTSVLLGLGVGLAVLAATGAEPEPARAAPP
ncbi:MAG: serine/threonine protein kinase [Polyangiaceae bacterium]|nr:serine/threonine protein kinase [Polyangiaceae bacterium]